MAKVLTYTIKANVDGVEKTIKKTANTMDNLNEAVGKYEELLGKAEVGSKKFKTIKKRLTDLKKEQEKATIASMSFGEAMTSIPGPIGTVSQGVKGLGTTMKVLAANPVIAFVTLLVGGLKLLFNAFKSTKKGGEQIEQLMGGLSAAFDVVRDIAVVLVEKLIAVFKNPKEALLDFGRALKQNIINRVTGMLELLPALGKAIGLAFKGKFKEAGKVATNAVGKVALGVENVTEKVGKMGSAAKAAFTEMKNEAAAAASVVSQLQKVADAQRELSVRRAEQNKEIAKAKELINDENLSYEDRLAALDKVAAAEKALNDQELSLAKQKLDAMEAEAALSDSNAETLDAIAQQKIEIANLELASSQKFKEVSDQRLGLLNRQKAEEKAAADEAQRLADEELKRQEEAAAKRLELKNRELDAEFELLSMADEKDLTRLKEILHEKMMLELDNADLTKSERLLIEEQYNTAVQALDQETADKKEQLAAEEEALNRSRAQSAANALGSISQALGENTEAGKMAAIAQAGINTYLAATEAYKAVVGIPVVGPTLAVGAAAAAVIAGIKQIQQIQSIDTTVKKPSPIQMASGGLVTGYGSDTSDNIPALLSPGESVINARSTRMFSNELSMMNQMGGGSPINFGALSKPRTSEGQTSPIIKTYVTSTDMTNQQQFDRQIKSRSTI